jgi:hypothetical protein
MGYTIAAHARTEELREQMLRFMNDQYQPWAKVMAGPPSGDFDGSASNPTTDLSYDKVELVIGFDYSGLSGWEREYVYAACRWMAIKIGKRKAEFPQRDGRALAFDSQVPYIVYDEEIEIPVGPDVDELGIKAPSTQVNQLRPLYPDAFFDLSDEEQEAFEAEAATHEGEEPAAAKQRRAELRNRYTKRIVDIHVGIIRSEMERLERLWQNVCTH